MSENKEDAGIPMNLHLDPKAIDEYIANSVLNSMLGDKIKKAVEETLKKSGGFSHNPVQAAVDNCVNEEVSRIVIKILRTNAEFQTKVETAVRAKMTEESMEEIMGVFFDKLLGKR